MLRLLEMISDSVNDFYAVIQNIKFSTSYFLIGGNVTELHYQSVLVIYVSAEVRLHLHATVILSSNLSQNKRNPFALTKTLHYTSFRSEYQPFICYGSIQNIEETMNNELKILLTRSWLINLH